MYGLNYHRFDRGGGYDFDRLDVDLVQHLPFVRETYVLSAHARVQSVVGDDAVPYFMMPALGGGSTLRAYSSFRYRDRHSLLVQGEFRWIPNRLGLDMAVFWDGGTVAPELDQLALRGFAHDFGVGLRLHTPLATPIRVELAFGQDGAKVGVRREGGVLMRSAVSLAHRVGAGPAAGRRRAAPGRSSGSTIRWPWSPRRRTPPRPSPATSSWCGIWRRTCSPVPAIRAAAVRAQNVNTIDEVPESSWFTNRILARPLSAAEVERGPLEGAGPAPGPWLVVAPKSAGFAPGFRMRDSAGTLWFVSLDPDGFNESASGALLVANKLFWAIGYHQVENFLASFTPEQLTLAPERPHPRRVRPGAADAPPGSQRGAGPCRARRPMAPTGPSPPGRCPGRRSAASSTTAPDPTIPTTSFRTSIAASCAP